MNNVIVAGGPAFAVLRSALCRVPDPILAAYHRHKSFPAVPSSYTPPGTSLKSKDATIIASWHHMGCREDFFGIFKLKF